MPELPEAGVDSFRGRFGCAVHCPLCNSEYALSEALALVPPELIPVVAEALESTSIADVAVEPPAEVEIPSSTETSRTKRRRWPSECPATSAAAVLQRRRSRSALRTVIEVVTGGLAGCLVAYYGLAFWFGPEFHRILPRACPCQ